jgi:hypothetical protein
MTADGTIPGRESPKYDLNGDLAWNVFAVEQSKEAVLDGIQSVEFLVKGGPPYYKYHVHPDKEEKFWEDVTLLNSSNCRHRINDFYEKNPKAYGAQSKFYCSYPTWYFSCAIFQAWIVHSEHDHPPRHRICNHNIHIVYCNV